MSSGESSGRVNCLPLCLAHSESSAKKTKGLVLKDCSPLYRYFLERKMCSSRLGIGSFLFSTFSTDIWHLDCDYNGAKEPPKNQDVAPLCIHM